MNIQDKIAELEKSEKALWENYNAIEESPEYKAILVNLGQARDEWAKIYCRLKAYKEMLKDGVEP